MDPIGEPDTHSRGQTPAFDRGPNGGRSITPLFDPDPFFSHVTEGKWISHGLDQLPHQIGDIPTRRPFLLRMLSLSHWPVTIVGTLPLIGGFAPDLCPFLPHAAERTENQPFPVLALVHLTHLLRDNSDRLHPRFTGRPGGLDTGLSCSGRNNHRLALPPHARVRRDRVNFWTRSPG